MRFLNPSSIVPGFIRIKWNNQKQEKKKLKTKEILIPSQNFYKIAYFIKLALSSSHEDYNHVKKTTQVIFKLIILVKKI